MFSADETSSTKEPEPAPARSAPATAPRPARPVPAPVPASVDLLSGSDQMAGAREKSNLELQHFHIYPLVN